TDDEGQVRLRAGSAARVRVVVDADTVPLGVAAPLGQGDCGAADEPPGYGAVCADAGSTVTVVLPLSSGVQSKVVDAAGQPVEGALVRAVPVRAAYREHATVASTGGDGSFFLGLVPGGYELQVLLPESYGDDRARARRLRVDAEEGAALLLRAIDYREPEARLDGPLAPADAAGAARVDRGAALRAAASMPVGDGSIVGGSVV
ncbi:MAG: carboxypeptidase-like regulatory domain-containing protein, partial [Planctomycetota bacterium]